MLLFTDGFECIAPKDIFRKWEDYIGTPQNDYLKIVSGVDNSVSPAQQFARRLDGRALYIANATSVPPLRAHIRKSRSVFVGFGFRYRQQGTENPVQTIKFYTREFPSIQRKYTPTGLSPYVPERKLVATCTFTIRGTYADTQWVFPSEFCPDVFGQVNANATIWNGDWHYFQFGITLHGNNSGGASAWVENRIGSNSADKIDNIFTAAPDSENSYYIDTVEITPIRYASYDDVYIANDEGNVNNDFLGPVHIRAALPETQGSINQGQPVNTDKVNRALIVNAGGFMGTVDTMPADPPTPEEDQHFIAWEDPRNEYLQLPRIGNTQTFDFQNPNFAGSEPKFFGAVAYMMVRPGHYDEGFTSIEPVMMSGVQEISATVPLRRPIMFMFDNEWEIRRGVFENPDVNDQTGFLSTIWNRTAISNAEWGLRVIRHVDDPESYLPEYLRVKYIFDDLLAEGLRMIDAPERYWEEMMALTFAMASESTMDLTWAVYEALGLNEDGSDGVRGLKLYTNSILYATDEIPWTFLFVNDQMSLDDTALVTWAQIVEETFDTQDIGYDLWVEEVPDGLAMDDDAIFVFTLFALDDLAIEDPIKTNHELIDDGFQADSSYIFSGHELIMETLYPEDLDSVGVLDVAEDGFGLEEEHYDGWDIVLVPHQYSVTDGILTQHWRHEFFLGICINSWQVDPIEQASNEGDRTGQFTSQYYDLVNG